MKKGAVILLLAGLSVGTLSAGEAGREKRARFGAAFSLIALSERGDVQSVIGPAGLIVFSVGRRFLIVPEVLIGVTGFFAGATFNVRFGRTFVGLGGVAGGLYRDRFEWNPISLVKVQAGIKGRRMIVALGYVNNLGDIFPRLSGLSLAVGYLF